MFRQHFGTGRNTSGIFLRSLELFRNAPGAFRNSSEHFWNAFALLRIVPTCFGNFSEQTATNSSTNYGLSRKLPQCICNTNLIRSSKFVYILWFFFLQIHQAPTIHLYNRLSYTVTVHNRLFYIVTVHFRLIYTLRLHWTMFYTVRVN